MKTFLRLFLLCLVFSSAVSKEIIVSVSGKISTITSALNLAVGGDTIRVKSGIYKESFLIINKPIVLMGDGFPIIDGEAKDGIIFIRSGGVTVTGFEIHNSAISSMTDYAALKVENVSSCNIENNRFVNNYFGIYLANSSGCVIRNNSIQSNAVTESSSGNGIHLWKCNNIDISGNNVSGHRDGIYFEFVTDSRVTGNTSRNNIRYGLHFMFSNNDSYEYNVFRQNGAGVAVMYSKNVLMNKNVFEENWGGNAYGLLLKDISDSRVVRNRFTKNTVGLYSEGGTRIRIEMNNFLENGWATKILGNCAEDTIVNNNFVGNTFDVATNSSRNENFFSENYWDKYNGYDLNNDGIGDVPYRPVSLFSMIIENTPESIVLLRSFIVDILDLSERVMPVFIPETLVDEKPLLKPAE